VSVLPILTWPDARLSTPCAPVGDVTDAVRALAEAMIFTMYDAPGRGLAAPQVGRMLRMFVMDASWKDGERNPQVLIDPVIEAVSEERLVMTEGCLSIPGITTEIERPAAIRLSWRGPDGTGHIADWTGPAARVAQHEIDHLDGIVTFHRLDAEAREAALAAYAEAQEAAGG
jgi:peptide deformylase